ncbi:uncharacterized protein LOC143553285 [Bidens hawaiensis]|uniref:uncharacterized protein LOC143553285 n=1 Tax=Bidens hawaiensis TaxID=980011 RepID=UPI00404B7B24
MIKEADPNKNNAKLKAIYNWMRRAKLPAQIIEIPKTAGVVKSNMNANIRNLTDLDVAWLGYHFFKKYMGLYVDTIFNFNEWNESRDFFLKLSAENAFRVVEVELNFMYDVLFTKLPVVYGKSGAICRIFSLVAVCIAIILFAFISKTKFWDTDVMITYALLFGALVMDTTALLMLLFSDWTIISFQKMLDRALHNSLKIKIIRVFLRCRTERKFQTETSTPQVTKSLRWSETIPSYNLIYCCLHPRPRLQGKIFDTLGLTNYLDSIVYVKSNSFSPDLKEFVFQELKSKALYAKDLPRAKEISSGRVDWVLKAEGWDNHLLGYVSDVDFDQSIILWHMATEICYNSEL